MHKECLYKNTWANNSSRENMDIDLSEPQHLFLK